MSVNRERCRNSSNSDMSITNLIESEKFLQKKCNIGCLEEFLQELLRDWPYMWDNFDDIAVDIHEKIKSAHEELLVKCIHRKYRDDRFSEELKMSLECFVLHKLHDYILPLIWYFYTEDDKLFYHKCKSLCDQNVTAEQFGAPEDYAIPLAAAVVEFASLDAHKSPIEKAHCLTTTFDLVYAELKSAIVEIISISAEENKIPVVENRDIMPVLMIVIIRSKLIHLFSNMYYIENFLWELQESEHIKNTIMLFKDAIAQIQSLNDENLRPSSSGKVHKNLGLDEVTTIMGEMETKSQNPATSLVENHMKRVTSLIFTSTSSIKYPFVCCKQFKKMVQYCCAYGCRNVWEPNSNIKFHRFPLKRQEILKLWLQALHRENFFPKTTTVICSDHFTLDSYLESSLNKKLLKKDAVPSIFCFNDITEKRTSPTHIEKHIAQEHSLSYKMINIKVDELCLTKEASTQTCQRKIEKSRNEIYANRKIKILQQRLKRREKSIRTMKGLETLFLGRKIKLNFAPKETVFTYRVVTHFRFALFVIAIVRVKLNLCFVGRTTYFKLAKLME
ncbi:hypothetical protein Trydic_g12274 [Trypoxylus dichotomus]